MNQSLLAQILGAPPPTPSPMDPLEPGTRVLTVDDILGIAEEVTIENVLQRRWSASIGTLGLSGTAAKSCCVKARNIATAAVQEGINALLAVLYGDKETFKDGYVTGTGIRVMDGGFATAGFYEPITHSPPIPLRYTPRPTGPGGAVLIVMVILTILVNGTVMKTDTQTAFEAANGIIGAILNRLRETAPEDCEACVRNRAWGQENPLRSHTGRHKSRR